MKVWIVSFWFVASVAEGQEAVDGILKSRRARNAEFVPGYANYPFGVGPFALPFLPVWNAAHFAFYGPYATLGLYRGSYGAANALHEGIAGLGEPYRQFRAPTQHFAGPVPYNAAARDPAHPNSLVSYHQPAKDPFNAVDFSDDRPSPPVYIRPDFNAISVSDKPRETFPPIFYPPKSDIKPHYDDGGPKPSGFIFPED